MSEATHVPWPLWTRLRCGARVALVVDRDAGVGYWLQTDPPRAGDLFSGWSHYVPLAVAESGWSLESLPEQPWR